MSVPEAGGPQALTLGWVTKTGGTPTNCNGTISGSFGKAGMSYATDDPSGPVGYVKLTATGPNVTTGCPAGPSVVDANSTQRGNYCYSVNVGLASRWR